MKKALVLFLALIMLLGALAACGPKQNTPSGNNGTNDHDTEADEAGLPVKDYSGKTYTVLYRQGDAYVEEWVSNEDVHGDVINDAIANRNQAVIDRYGVELDYETGQTGGDFTADFWPKVLNNTEDDTYQLIAGYTYRLATVSTRGSCLNWLNKDQVPVVNLDADWWDGEFTRAASYNDCSYIATGPLSLTDMYSSACIYFNKTLLNNILGGKSENPTEDLFELVREGKWTLDKLIEYAKACTNTIEGAETDENDIYGLSSDFNTMVDAFIYASNMVMTERVTKNGRPTIALKKVDNSNPILQLASKLQAFYRTSGYVKKDDLGNPGMVRVFSEGKSVFSTGTLASAKEIQNYGENILYGVIPYPKYVESQTNYYTYKVDSKTGFCIPRTVYTHGDPEFVGTITEALAYYSNKFVKPALYDKVLTHKNVQDKDSSEFVMMIVNGGLYEFANIYAFAWDDQKSPAHLLRETIKEGSNFYGEYKGRIDQYNTKLDALLRGFSSDEIDS